MKVWLVNVTDHPPVDDTERPLRVSMLAEHLLKNGCDVLWWSTTFQHGTKEYVCSQDHETVLYQTGSSYLLHAPVAYKRNMSVARLMYSYILGKKFRKVSGTKEKPDVIFCSMPTIQVAQEVVRYGKKNHIPVIIDIRDLWPDIFVRALPKVFHPFSKVLLYPLQRKIRYICKEASGLTSVTPAGLEWGLKKAGRVQTEKDDVFYIGVKNNRYSEEEWHQAQKAWAGLGVTKETVNFCFFGSFSKLTKDLCTVFAAAETKELLNLDYRIIVCGKGDLEKELKQAAGKNENILFPGWMNELQMDALMGISNAGLYIASNTFDFKDAMGNRLAQYLSRGLPVITNLEGSSRKYLLRNGVGYYYREGDVSGCKRALLDAAGNPPDIREKAISCFEQDFDEHRINKRIMEYLSQISDNKRGKQ